VTAAPDYVEPVVAWRAWKTVRRNGEWRLSSIFAPTPRALWSPRVCLTAECLAWRPPWEWLRPRHEAPDPTCECGIYATSLDALYEFLTPSLIATSGGRHVVLGRVSLWGTVVECDRGWRAALAYPERLFVPALAWRTVDQAASVARDLERYDVPVQLVSGRLEDAFTVVPQLVRPLVLRPAA
jgi:hypothetical protein